MRKIIITDKEELKLLKDAFPPANRFTIWKALSFTAKSIRASRIRCYAMNFLQSAEYLTTTH